MNNIRNKKEIEESYASILADYATKFPKYDSRLFPDDNDDNDNRSSFQRDRDRIIHTKAFRRLMYKTQVFVNHEGDHFRTRLTHTLEVSQFARGISKSLALNEDLAEAIALGHDLGHTPFGHAVERYIDEELNKREFGRFFHNEQSVRVVDYLEKRKSGDACGLNLTCEVREGILKHNNDRSGIYKNLNPSDPCSNLEGQIVSLVDTIAYICHDLEDAIASGIVYKSLMKNEDLKLKLEEFKKFVYDKTQINIEYDTNETFFIRDLIHYFIKELTTDSWNNIEKNKIKTLDDVKVKSKENITLIQFSDENNEFFKKIRKFVYENIYGSQTIVTMDYKAVEVIKKLFDAYENNPKLLPPEILYKYNHTGDNANYTGAKDNQIRTIFDYISCMTDRYALEEYERLFNPLIKI